MNINLFFVCLVYFLVNKVISQDVFGCGGFVQSDVSIKYEKVEVKLYTKQGAFKLKTECTPNNGYFLAAVYDKGDYVLKINPPEGWGFSPLEIELSIDGVNDACSKGEDLNFKFTGFTLDGSILSSGKEIGPSGVSVKLTSKDKVMAETLTIENGVYQFQNIMPGDYNLKASHSTWTMENNDFAVKVVDDIIHIKEQIVVSGYDVKGHVLSTGEPIQGVNFLVFSSDVLKKSIKNCEEISKNILSVIKHDTKETPLCMVTSKEDGSFLFPSLPTGSYVLVPYYSAQNILFDIVPAKLAFSVNVRSVVLKTPFQVYGFSVRGKILDSTKNGIDGVDVIVTSEQGVTRRATTSSDGGYLLENVTTGHYVFKMEKSKYYFVEEKIHITPNSPTLKDIFVSQYSICGEVVVKQMPVGVRKLHKVKVLLQPEGQQNTAIKTTTLDTAGKFCFQSAPGKFKVEVPVIDSEVKMGFLLNPSHRNIEVINKPLEDLQFKQFLAVVSGSLQCIDQCNDVSVFMQPTDTSSGKKVYAKVEGSGKSLKFVISDVLPGKYKIVPQRKKWCWEPQSKEVEIKDKNIVDVQLKHSGYYLKCIISHNITLNFALENSKEEVGSFELKNGENQFCLKKPGVYVLNPISCYKFEQEMYTYNTDEPKTLNLDVAAYKVEISVQTAIKVSDLKVEVGQKYTDKPSETITPEKTKSDDKTVTYEAVFWGRPEEYIFTPISKEVLFTPSEKIVMVEKSCPGGSVVFEGHQGIFIEGKINPALFDVHVKIKVQRADGKEAKEFDVMSDQYGAYRIGPMHHDTIYDVSASKEGYYISPDPDTKGNFIARKLGQISVTVTDEEGVRMSNVLISLSGKQYRNNNLTKSDGAFLFPNLNPGQYFLKPMQKEYDFTPNSKMIDVTEGADVVIPIKGKRVAFSCSGSVASLAGLPEEKITIEAVGIHKCSEYQEATVSDKDGNFRLRGLHPGCSYNVRLSRNGDENKAVERLAPENHIVQVSNNDINDVNFLVFMKPTKFTVTAYIDTDPKFLHTLEAQLYEENKMDFPVHTVNLNVLKFIQFPPLPPKNYIVKLTSTLSGRTHDIVTTTATVIPDDTLQKKHVKLKFEAKEKKIDMEPTQSVVTLPLAVALIFLAYNYDAVLAFFEKANLFILNMSGKNNNVIGQNGEDSQDDFLPPMASTAGGKLARRKKR